MKIIFAGTPVFAQKQLEALLEARHEILAVYTQPDKPAGRGRHPQASPVKSTALAHDIPVHQPESLKTPEDLATLASYHADVMIVAAYGLILPKALLALPRFGCINVHASLLPRGRGASPIQQAILSGDVESGITLMQMDAGLDSGDILAQASYTLTSDETTTSLQAKLADLGAKLLCDSLLNITENAAPIPQNPSLVTYAGKIVKEQAKIDWDQPAEILERKIRAFQPWPIAYTTIDTQVLRLWQAKIAPLHPLPSTSLAGTILEHSRQGLLVRTQTSPLLLQIGQLPGKKPMPFQDLIRGHQRLFALGKRLGIS